MPSAGTTGGSVCGGGLARTGSKLGLGGGLPPAGHQRHYQQLLVEQLGHQFLCSRVQSPPHRVGQPLHHSGHHVVHRIVLVLNGLIRCEQCLIGGLELSS